MKTFIRIDPHMASCTLAVVGKNGKRLREMAVAPGNHAPEILRRALNE